MALRQFVDEGSSLGHQLLRVLLLFLALIWACVCSLTNLPVFLALCLLDWHEWHRLTFDACRWRDEEGKCSAMRWSPIRLQMVQNLLRQDILRGKTRQQITALLGHPTSGSLYRIGGGYVALDFLKPPFCLLPCPISLLSFVWRDIWASPAWYLVMDFDAQGVFREARITRSDASDL